MDWFYKISYPFMRPTQPRDPPRHPPIVQDETYVEPDKPQYPVPVAAMEEAPTYAPSDVEQPRHAVISNVALIFYQMSFSSLIVILYGLFSMS